MLGDSIPVYSMQDFQGLRRAGALAAKCLDGVGEMMHAGVELREIDDFVWGFARKNGAAPATLNYRGYPASCCVSVNDVVCHGVPGKRKLREGDIAAVDVTLVMDGWHGDSCRTWRVGRVSRVADKLVRAAYAAMWKGIKTVRAGGRFGDIGAAVQGYAEKHGFSVVEAFGGHGIGREFHMGPSILFVGREGEGEEIVPGMVFTVEPMINVGRKGVVIDGRDGWTARTEDGKLSAQFEHTIGVGENGVEVFTENKGDGTEI